MNEEAKNILEMLLFLRCDYLSDVKFMLQKDFDFIVKIWEEFINRPKIIKRLNIIHEKGITGWEIWLQIEFATFLESHTDVSDWKRELRYNIDGRRNKIKKCMSIDFLVRRKRAKKAQYIAIELKQNLNVNTCIKKMFEDYIKVDSIKGSEDDLRSIWNIGVHPENSKVDEIIKRHMLKGDLELSDTRIKTIKIDDTQFSFTIF